MEEQEELMSVWSDIMSFHKHALRLAIENGKFVWDKDFRVIDHLMKQVTFEYKVAESKRISSSAQIGRQDYIRAYSTEKQFRRKQSQGHSALR